MSTTAADAHFAGWMRGNLDLAARHFNLNITGEPVVGWRLRSIGARAEGVHGPCWLRVVSQEPEWACGHAWTGTLAANAIRGVSKPTVLDVFEWTDGRIQRAEVTTLLSGKPCSRDDVLRSPPTLADQWWSDLVRSLSMVAATPTDRVNSDQNQITRRIWERFDGPIDTTVGSWETVHGDVHWSNVVHPTFGLLDWELWGRGPVGTDAATLLCYSLLVPEIAEQVHARFAGVLDTPTGRIAQLYVASRLLRRIEGGDHPDLAEPIIQHAQSLLPADNEGRYR